MTHSADLLLECYFWCSFLNCTKYVQSYVNYKTWGFRVKLGAAPPRLSRWESYILSFQQLPSVQLLQHIFSKDLWMTSSVILIKKSITIFFLKKTLKPCFKESTRHEIYAYWILLLPLKINMTLYWGVHLNCENITVNIGNAMKY